MLVLSRKKGEMIKIADNIYITVVDLRGDKVRLGIEAPKDVIIMRTEIIPQEDIEAPGETTSNQK